jgi:hypothetical protein
MYLQRKSIYEELEANRHSKVLVYVTGDRPGLETKIASEVYDYFVNQLDRIGPTPKISLILYTRGGDTLAAWSIINLIYQFTEDLEVIIPSKCHSAGTLMSLGAKRIIMTKQATLGPIDPSIEHPLNPMIPGAPPGAKIPVSVEAVEGFINFLKSELGFTRRISGDEISRLLSQHIHPIVIGTVYRTKEQIKMLASRLLKNQIQDRRKTKKIISFLCSDSGSHDYTIHRREARDLLGLNIEKPDDTLYSIIKRIYDDIEQELLLTQKLDPNSLIGAAPVQQYTYKRCLIETVVGGSYYFSSEGQMTRQQIQTPQGLQMGIVDNRTYEGWKYEQ